MSTKIHLGCLNEKNLISISLTGGEVPDVKGFDSVFNQLPENHAIESAIMDKGYDCDDIRETIADSEIVAVIPPSGWTVGDRSRTGRQKLTSISSYISSAIKLRDSLIG